MIKQRQFLIHYWTHNLQHMCDCMDLFKWIKELGFNKIGTNTKKKFNQILHWMIGVNV